jgi:HK97 family phage portal protein
VSIFDRIFRKSRSDLPSSITANTNDIESPGWSIDVINELAADYETFARPFGENPIVRAAIEGMRRNATKAVLQVGYIDDEGGFEPIEHPLLKIWPNPHPGYTDANLLEEAYLSLIGEEGDGNAYIQLIDSKAGDAVTELLPIPPLWVRQPRMGESIGQVETWPVMGADWGRIYNFDVPADRMLHIKTGRSAGGPTLGRSPLRSVAADMALIKLASVYETTILTRAGVPSWIVKLIGAGGMMATPDQISVMQNDFRRAVSGKAVGRPAIFKGDIDILTPGFSPEQLSVAKMAEMAVCRVCGVLGWAPMSLKQPDAGKTYSNLIEANKASWRDAVLPFLEQLATALTKAVRANAFRYGDEFFAADPNLCVRFDTSQIEELAVDLDKMADRAVKLIGAGVVTVDEARAILGMGEMTDDQREELMPEPEDPQETQDQEEANDAEPDR